MSERGSFVTEFVYCKKCFAVVRDVLVKNDKFLRGIVIPAWGNGDGEMPIVAGKIGGHSVGGEFVTMEFELGEELNARLCHPVRIAVLSDSGECRCFTFGPESNGVENHATADARVV